MLRTTYYYYFLPYNMGTDSSENSKENIPTRLITYLITIDAAVKIYSFLRFNKHFDF